MPRTTLYNHRRSPSLFLISNSLLCFEIRAPQSDFGRKSRPNLGRFDPVKFRGGVGEMSKSIFSARYRTRPFIYF